MVAGTDRLRAQPEPTPDQLPGAGYKVGTITIKFVGTANVNEQLIRDNMQLHDGGDLDDTILDRDIRNLYKTGLFEYIQTKWETAGPRTYNLVVEVTPKFRVLSVIYVGNKKVKSSRLGKEVKTKPNTALDDRQVKEDSEKIREYYQKEGYNQVAVTYKVDRDRSTGFGTITFQIKEGNKVRIADIRFMGNAHIKTKALRGQMDTKKWWMFSWLTGSGRFKDDDFDDDLDKLRDYYRENGYLDVVIAEDKVVFDYPKPDRLVLVIAVSEGRQYRVGQIAFSGNKLHSSSLLRRVVRQKPGAVFAPSKMDKDAERLEDFYGKDGYLYTNAKLIRKPNIVTGNIDVEYQIDEGDRFNVESIVIEGNTKSKSVIILRELVLGPGDVFDTYRMKVSKLRLENTRFFDDVNVTHQSTNLPGRENMRVAVKEGRTGSLTFGAGYSSLERATVFAEISQSNFDLFNSRSLFQGDGQKFRIRLELGELSSEAIISFEEPYFLEKELALGFSIFRTSSDYESTYYDEVDVGASVYLRKRLFEQIQAQLGYTFRVVEIQNVSTSASPIIQAAAGNNTESSVSLSLTRDTRDKIVSATSGNYMSLTETVAGGLLGGENNYYKTEFRGSQFFELFETQAQVLELVGRAGVIQNFGSSTSVPYYDAWYLGGPDDLRGFEYRFVSPRDIYGEPIGGKTYDMFTAEYSIDIVSPIRFALFYDAGSVNPGSYDFSPGNYQDDVGVGLRLFVMGAPLSLDYGIPMRGDVHYATKAEISSIFPLAPASKSVLVTPSFSKYRPMKKLIQTLLSLGAFGAAAVVAQAQPAPKIVVVDMAKLFAGHYETQAKEVELADARAKAKSQIDEMNKDGDALVAQYKELDEQSKSPTASPEAKAKALTDAQQKGKEIQAKMQDVQTFANNANQMIQQRVQAFRTVVTEEITKIVKTVATRHDATLVLDKSGPSQYGFPIVISADPAYDITEEVATEINKNRPPASATAPASMTPAAPAPSTDAAPQITVPGVTPSK